MVRDGIRSCEAKVPPSLQLNVDFISDVLQVQGSSFAQVWNWHKRVQPPWPNQDEWIHGKWPRCQSVDRFVSCKKGVSKERLATLSAACWASRLIRAVVEPHS